jgi:hypothetical protein
MSKLPVFPRGQVELTKLKAASAGGLFHFSDAIPCRPLRPGMTEKILQLESRGAITVKSRTFESAIARPGF